MSPDRASFEFGDSTEQRVERLIHYAIRQGNTTSVIVEDISDIKRRLAALEQDRQARAVADARAEERDKNLMQEITYVKDSLKALKSVMNKATAIIFGAVLLAVVKWVLDGNLGGMQ